MNLLILIPTLNEEKNILLLYEKIKKNIIKFNILFIDDNSRDNTRKIIQNLSEKYTNVNYIFRDNKSGVGSAHKDGFKYAYNNNYDILITMDADGTHNPDLIVKFLEKIKFYDIISTNRFLNQNSIKDWPVHRKFLTIIRYKLTKYFLKQEYDSSGAFRCYNLKKIKLSDLLLSKDNRYAFFWQSIFFFDNSLNKI